MPQEVAGACLGDVCGFDVVPHHLGEAGGFKGGKEVGEEQRAVVWFPH